MTSAEVRPRVGVIGAGQLVRMQLAAAAALDIDLRVLADSDTDAAVLAGATATVGDRGDLDTLRTFAAGVDVVTFELEGVDPVHLERLAADGVALVPTPAALLACQDKLHQRRTLHAAGFPVPPFEHVRDLAGVSAFADEHGWPVVLKAPRGGYDGRGVEVVGDTAGATRFLAGLPDGALAEPALALECELSVQVARTAAETAVYPVVETVQVDAVLRELIAPARIPDALAGGARELAVGIARELDVRGLLAVELFVLGGELVVNELAMRPHNSGHHTIEAAVTSQFEQHLRAVLGWPLGATELLAPAAVTVNVLGGADGSDPRNRLAQALAVRGAHVHLYGKAARAGRKLGHVTALGADVGAARAVASEAAGILEG